MLTITSSDYKENSILGALTAGEIESLVPHLELVTLLHSEVVFEDNDKLQYAYFPI